MAQVTIVLLLGLSLSNSLVSHEGDRREKAIVNGWLEPFVEIGIPSTTDGSIQKAFFWATSNEEPQPLVVSLHTWSGDYLQEDELAHEVVANGWNYIHPDFRGPNRRMEACGSPLVISDIDDAIDYALSNAKVDRSQIHVIGKSGGGYATLLAYMKSKHDIRSFCAWVPISNLIDWYYEVQVREVEHAEDIALSTSGYPGRLDKAQARLRSPVFMETPVHDRRNSKLSIYCGVHDGYVGSVPIGHSINIYNKIVDDFDFNAVESKVSRFQSAQLIERRSCQGRKVDDVLGDRDIVYQASYLDKVKLTIFDGGHEMIEEVALDHIPAKTILALGDSNGASSHGWVNQLKRIRFTDLVVNQSISGNTIGFDNNNKEGLNTLKNLDRYLSDSVAIKGGLDAVVILLGANDCKTIVEDRLDEVSTNYSKLLSRIKAYDYPNGKIPRIFIITPPPYGPENILARKYQWAGERVKRLSKEFSELARNENCVYIDIHSPLEPLISYLSKDGVHLDAEGQTIVAKVIDKALRDHLD